MKGQDISPAEIEKAQEIRRNLIQKGIIQPQQTTSFQSASADPIIEYSSYTDKKKSVSTSGARDTYFKPDGTRFYVVGRGSANIVEYHLSSSWNIESASYVRELDISPEMGSEDQSESVPHGLFIQTSDGKKMWVLNRTEIWEYTLSTAWDITSAAPTGYKDLSSDLVRGHDMDFRPNGKVLYVDDRIVGVVNQFNLSTAWDVETASHDYAFDISGQQQEVRGTQFSQDGDRIFLMDTGRKEVLEYYLTTPYDLRSASFIGDFSVQSQTSSPRGISFNTAFNGFYVSDNSDNIIYQYKIAIPDPAKSTVAASNSKVVANGTATSRITVTIRDQDGDRISDRKVSLSANSSNSTISNVNSTTNSNGEARFDISNSAEESVTYTAKSSNVTINQTVSVHFVSVSSAQSSVAASNEKVIADGNAAGRITVTARDVDGDRLEDVRITLNSNSSNASITNIRADTDSNGEAVFEVSNTVAESVKFIASGMGNTIDQTVTVRFVTVNAGESSVASNKQKVHANGIATSTITVTVRDEDGDELQDVEVTLIPDGGNSKIEALQNPTNSIGVAEFQVSSEVAGVVKYQAKGFGVTINEQASVNFIPIDPDESEMTLSTQKILANGSAEATITVTARDEDGNVFQNADVTLQQSGGSSDITKVQEQTDSDGIAIFRVRDGSVGQITYSASALGVTIGQTVTAKFVTVDPDESTIAVTPGNVQANGDEESRITVTAHDEDGDVLQGARIVLKALNGRSAIENAEITTNSDGIALFTVTNEFPESVDYTVTAEGIEFPQQISVGFIPIAPVSLSASQVEAREFNANWEMVQGAGTYLIDVAVDSLFTNITEPYNAFDVGNVTTFTVDDILPGTTYLYRVRAVSEGLIGANSEPVQTTTYPDTPEAVSASARNALKFTANWQEAEGARRYRLDVARDASFNDIIPEFNNLDAGTALHYTVTNLTPGENYFYRVRSEAGPRVSSNSNSIETSTLTISSEQSEIGAAQLRVLANGTQANELQITVKSDEGILLEGLEVVLNQTGGNSDIEGIQPVTDDEGVAVFGVTSSSAGKATYAVMAAGISIGDTSVEFLQDDGVLQLKDNFPNPFRDQTILPLTVPRPMMINITVYNSIGIPVRTVLDEQMETGYYEVPFKSNELAAGVYFYRLVTDGETMTGKMVMVK